jgi:hypothetical protein
MVVNEFPRMMLAERCCWLAGVQPRDLLCAASHRCKASALGALVIIGTLDIIYVANAEMHSGLACRTLHFWCQYASLLKAEII